MTNFLITTGLPFMKVLCFAGMVGSGIRLIVATVRKHVEKGEVKPND